MKDWTQDIPGNVSQIKIRYTIITRDHGHRRREVFDTLQEAQDESDRMSGIPFNRELTVTYIN